MGTGPRLKRVSRDTPEMSHQPRKCTDFEILPRPEENCNSAASTLEDIHEADGEGIIDT